MSVSPATTQQVHTILDGGIRYETAELVLSTIPNFELKQKGRILYLFTEELQNDENAFIQEIQEALDERQNNFDSLLARRQERTPFTFESQIDTDAHLANLSLKSTDDALQQPENNISNETVTLCPPHNEKENQNQRRKSSSTSKKDLPDIKTEAITPPKSKRRKSKHSSKSNRNNLSSIPSMRQMTMTQLFDPIESPTTSVKQEPNTPPDDAMMFMPESLIGLAQPSGRTSETESEQNNLSDIISPLPRPLKRKLINDDTPEQRITTDEEEEDDDIQNEALLQSPYSNGNNEELLYACSMCRNYWLGLPEGLRRKEGLTCRHRQRPAAHTPEHFWSLGIPSTQTCIQRGYGGVLPPDKPIQRPRRPRRQYQRRLQEQQQEEQNDQMDDEEN